MKKKILALTLTLLMVLALVPVASFAGDEEPLREYTDDCITFSSDAEFSVMNYTQQKTWDGYVLYSTNKTDWEEWNGNEIYAAKEPEGDLYFLYMRGIYNTRLTEEKYWVISATEGKGVSCTGNIETLRGATGKEPSNTKMGESCYAFMFYRCTCLTSAPELPATSLAKNCYADMFYGCTNLTNAPDLPATNLAENCYDAMFLGCTNLAAPSDISHVTNLANNCCDCMYFNCTGFGVYESNPSGQRNSWTAPNAKEIPASWASGMFSGTSGDFTKDPTPGTTYYMESAPTEFTVTFDTQEHGITPGEQTVPRGGYVEKPKDPKAEGYTFMGWFTEPECENEWDFENYTVTADTKLYAWWDATDYIITYELNGGMNHESNPYTYTIEDGDIVLGAATKEGCTFDGWYKDAAFTQRITEIAKGSTGNITLYAKWTEDPTPPVTKYTVTFDMQGHGTQIEAQQVEKGKKVTKPTAPEESGYTFGGWYKESTCETAWDFESDTVTVNTTLYAKWTENPTPPAEKHTVTFDTAGKCTAPEAQTVEKGGKVKKPDSPAAEGFVFGGWYTDNSTFEESWDFDNDTVTEDITLYAKWVQTTEDVAEVVVSDKVKTNVEIEDAEANAKKVLEQFAPYCKPDDELSLIVKVSDEVSKEDAEKIKKASGDSETSMLDVSLWLKVNDKEPVDISGYNNELITLVYDFDYTKKIDIKAFRVHEGGLVEQLPVYPKTINNGECVRYDEDNSKVYITAWKYSTYDITFTLLNDPETTAAKTEYPVTFDSMGGTAVNGQHHAKGEKIEKPSDPTKQGYTFAGWYLDKNYTQAWNFNLYTVSGPTTLYAKWTAAGAGTGGSNVRGNTPNTGDSNTAWIYILAGILSAAALAVCLKKRKQNDGRT